LLRALGLDRGGEVMESAENAGDFHKAGDAEVYLILDLELIGVPHFAAIGIEGDDGHLQLHSELHGCSMILSGYTVGVVLEFSDIGAWYSAPPVSKSRPSAHMIEMAIMAPPMAPRPTILTRSASHHHQGRK
jgi:hypothetical protein